MVKPYYSQGGITIYCGKAEEIVLGLPRHHFVTLVMDPPYTFRFERLAQFDECLTPAAAVLCFDNLTPTHEEFGHPHARDTERLRKVLDAVHGGPILDPYMGSGTTLVVAKELGREAVGIDIEECYCRAAAERLDGILTAWASS